ncbi:helix-turn-helix domain-containing protein [Actinomadura hibisca]|uniref:helix-turn-helix domain-containing protein n=1 Tax=Actinomadura hibisca TaxID=68565 RepID=UPI0012FBDF98|nr:helix-turn-helix domain-containing protein [Actinomadura hibisca]
MTLTPTELHERVPAVAREVVHQIRRDLPAFACDPWSMAETAERALGHFVDLLDDRDPPSGALMEHFRRIGAREAREGRDLEPLRAALRIGTGTALRHLTEEVAAQGPPAAVAHLMEAALAYLDRLLDAAADGHADAPGTRRRRLLEKLVAQDLTGLDRLAADCGWPLPRTVAAVALRASPTAARPALDPDTLLGLHLAEPCAMVPDPQGSGRSRVLRAGLRGWTAAIGPTVPLAEAGRSLALARRALPLAAARTTLVVTDHLPLLLLDRDPDLVSALIDHRLRPLLGLPAASRRRLAETLLACIESGFNATEVAGRLYLHAQTVRYRVRQLEAVFGQGIHDPDRRLDYHLAVRAWLACADAADDP